MSAQSKVHWLANAADRLRADLKEQLARELGLLFDAADVHAITVHDYFAGYSMAQEKKAILGVEVHTRDFYETHIVKLGRSDQVKSDYDGWQKCAANRYIGSRFFVRVRARDLPDGRAGIIYQDAYRLFGPDSKTQGPRFLEDVVNEAILHDSIDVASIERVLWQIYGDLHRWFYHTAGADSQAVVKFYNVRFENSWNKWAPTEASSAIPNEELDWRMTLRSDAIWLLCGLNAPAAAQSAAYLDPYDYLRWAFKNGNIPQTLIGCSHGDLHGRNILIGVRRSEAESPAIIDYGRMDNANVLVWDFVKLEYELKTRIIPVLYRDPQVRSALVDPRITAVGDRETKLHTDDGAPRQPLPLDLQARAERADRLKFAFAFETLLAAATSRIAGRSDAECSGPALQVTSIGKINRALQILLRIRREAALCLGYEQPGRHSLWRDEYYFAAAVYGLVTAKWPNYERIQSECALISAGVAAAHLSAVKHWHQASERAEEADSPAHSYEYPLAQAHACWAAHDLAQARTILEKARCDFPCAVPLNQEYALVLADDDRLDAARDVIQSLRSLCLAFGDFETLARLGRVFKNQGDRHWEDSDIPFGQFRDTAAWQYYREAFQLYREAFHISGRYFPGVNTATLALILGKLADANEYAEKVLEVCQREQIGARGDELYWIFASEGEAVLVSQRHNRAELAAGYFEAALNVVGPEKVGMVQSTWNQLCRLHRVLGPETLAPIIEVFKEHKEIWKRLKAGPLGDCDTRRRQKSPARGRVEKRKR